jgi:Type II secretion system (T2SS), protein M subtype b
MGRSSFQFLIWRLHRLGRRMSLPAAAALMVLAINVMVFVSLVAPALERRSALSLELETMRNESRSSEAVVTKTRSPADDLALFYGALARLETAPDLLQKLHETAGLQQLKVEKAEYRPVADPGGKITRYQIVLPARGTYPAVRKFLALAGREVPGLALDGINFQRQKIGDEQLQAQIKFTLFLGVPG